MNLCFKNLGIMNLLHFGSGIMNNETEKSSTKCTYKLVAFDPGNAGYGVSESPVFQNFSRKACPRTPYIIRLIGAHTPLVSPVTWCLMFSYPRKLYT